jgi:hypothetical protein
LSLRITSIPPACLQNDESEFTLCTQAHVEGSTEASSVTVPVPHAGNTRQYTHPAASSSFRFLSCRAACRADFQAWLGCGFRKFQSTVAPSHRRRVDDSTRTRRVVWSCERYLSCLPDTEACQEWRPEAEGGVMVMFPWILIERTIPRSCSPDPPQRHTTQRHSDTALLLLHVVRCRIASST